MHSETHRGAAEDDVDPREHSIGIIITSHDPPKGIGFSVKNKKYFTNMANNHDLPMAPTSIHSRKRFISRIQHMHGMPRY